MLPQLASLVLIGVTVGTILLYNFQFWHVVNEGHIGVYYRMGRMIDTSTQPGMHFRLPPPITKALEVYVRPQVDAVEQVTCGAKDGTSILFPQIEVGNTLPDAKAVGVVKKYGPDYDQFLVYKQVQYITNGLCSQFTSHEIAIEKFNDLDDYLKEELEQIQQNLDTGLEIGFVRIAKPQLPRELAEAYQRQAAERALKKAKEEEFLRIQQENLNEQERVKGIADQELMKAEKQNDMDTSKQKASQLQQKIENEMNLDKAETDASMIRSKAKAEADAIRERASANLELLTPAYLELKKTEAMFSNAKIIFGNEIPQNAFFSGSDHNVSEQKCAIV